MKPKRIYFLESVKIVFSDDPGAALGILFLKLILALIPTLQTIAIAEFINCVSSAEDLELLTHSNHLKLVILAMVLMVAYTWIAKTLIELLCNHLEMNLNSKYKSKIVEKVSRLKYQYMEDEETRDRIGRVNYKVPTLIKNAYMDLLRLTEMIIKILGILIIMFTQVWWMAVLILIVSIPCFYISMRSGEEHYDADVKMSKNKRIYEYYNEVLQNREYVDERSLFRYQDDFMNRYIQKYEDTRKYKTRIRAKWFIRMKLGSMATIIVSATMIATFLPLTLNGKVSIGMFIALANAVFNIVQNMSWDLTDAIDANVWSNEYFKDMNLFWNMEEESEDKKELEADFESLEFRNVSFKYPGTENYVLKDVSFTIVGNKNYAFVGANGAGKSTIIKLCNGLYDNYEGTILVNGKNIQEYDRKFIGNIFQDFARYPLSIKDNITIGRKDPVSDDELQSVVKKVGLGKTVSKLANGLDTVLGKVKSDSVDLSGGEWQKIALARCNLMNSPVKILDEPTSAMDPIYEAELYKEFKEMSICKTMLLISHRLASVQMVDTIFVLNDGTIVEQGNHTDLLNKNGLYAEMYKEQAKWYIEGGKELQEDYES